MSIEGRLRAAKCCPCLSVLGKLVPREKQQMMTLLRGAECVSWL